MPKQLLKLNENNGLSNTELIQEVQIISIMVFLIKLDFRQKCMDFICEY